MKNSKWKNRGEAQYNAIQILLSTPHGGFSETITKIERIRIRRKVLKGYR